jgi:LPS sulfotransferase NodH
MLKFLSNKYSNQIKKLSKKKVNNYFALFTSPRSGSKWAVELLSNHPEVRVFGELFRVPNIPREEHLDLLLDDPLSYLHSYLYEPQSPAIKAIGFKMFYSHANAASIVDDERSYQGDIHPELMSRRENFKRYLQSRQNIDDLLERFAKVWEYLRDNPNIGIIHLIRWNKLEQYLSLYKAWSLNQWKDSPGKRSNQSFHIDPRICELYFERIAHQEESFRIYFQDKTVLTIIFEEFIENPQHFMDNIYSFLELSPFNNKIATRNKVISKLYQIENYESLKEYFSDTQWVEYFTYHDQ